MKWNQMYKITLILVRVRILGHMNYKLFRLRYMKIRLFLNSVPGINNSNNHQV